MKGKRLITTIFALVTIISMFLSTSIYAGENKNNKITITAQEKSQIVESLHDNGVDNKTINRLIEKLEDGIMWDSFKEEYRNIRPAYIIESPDGTITEKYVYPDGSIRVSTLVVPKYNHQPNDNQTINPMSVGGGTWISGSGYRTCYGAYVKEDMVLLLGAFYADFTLLDGAYDYISDAYDYEIRVIGGTHDDDSLVITRSTETSTKYAEAKLQWTTDVSGGASSTCWVKLNVGKNSYFSSHN